MRLNNLNVAILDLNSCNMFSLLSSLKFLGVKNIKIVKERIPENFTHLIIPGVGSFDNGMRQIIKKNFDKLIFNSIKKNIPILGICLGMQILFSGSDEGRKKGLSIFKTKIRKLRNNEKFKVPNIGFKSIIYNNQADIFKDINQNSSFYFLHSFGLIEDKSSKIFDNYATSLHSKRIICAFKYKKIFATQFHPEKSQSNGLMLLKNFLSI